MFATPSRPIFKSGSSKVQSFHTPKIFWPGSLVDRLRVNFALKIRALQNVPVDAASHCHTGATTRLRTLVHEALRIVHFLPFPEVGALKATCNINSKKVPEKKLLCLVAL